MQMCGYIILNRWYIILFLSNYPILMFAVSSLIQIRLSIDNFTNDTNVKLVFPLSKYEVPLYMFKKLISIQFL